MGKRGEKGQNRCTVGKELSVGVGERGKNGQITHEIKILHERLGKTDEDRQNFGIM